MRYIVPEMLVTSMSESHNHNAAVTLPVFIECKPTQRRIRPDVIFYTFVGRQDTGRAVAGLIVPPNAAAAVAGLDRSALHALEKKFGKLPKGNIAEILAVSKLIDGVRLKDTEKLEQHLAYVRAGAGSDYEAMLRKHFDAREGWPGVLGWAMPHLNALCSLGRLCVWMSNRGAEPMTYAGEPLRLGLHAADITSALLLQLLLQMEESASIAYCEHCGNAYVRTKQDQRFCGFRCGSRERQARYRQARRKKGQRLGRKIGGTR
jgi:predicted RNA-binding Zn ribbon-like protein